MVHVPLKFGFVAANTKRENITTVAIDSKDFFIIRPPSSTSNQIQQKVSRLQKSELTLRDIDSLYNAIAELRNLEVVKSVVTPVDKPISNCRLPIN
jgi:hypothetical protein